MANELIIWKSISAEWYEQETRSTKGMRWHVYEEGIWREKLNPY